MVRGFETGGNQLSDNITLLDTSTASEKRHSTDSNFPVLPVAITVIVSSIIVTVLVTLYLVRRQRQAEKYKQYSQIAETAVQPPQFSVKTTQQPFPAKKKLCRTKEKIISSEESLSPMSSEEMFFDAQERLEGKASRSISSREASPASALEEEEKEEDEVYPVDHLGRIWFNLEYDKSAESLAVTLVKGRNLSTRGKASKTCDPFVKLRILGPEEKERNVSQSKNKRKTCRPNFDEMFYFNMPVSELKRCTLRLSVYDGFRASQQSVIGEVLFPLSELDTDQKLELWRDLAANEESPSELGEIHISMSYYPTLDRLTIIVLRASNLKKMEPHGTDSYPKVTFSIGNKIIKTKKGPLHHGSRDPLYNESFNFSVSGDDLGSGTLLVSIMHSRGGGKEDQLVGRVLLGGMMYARGTECEHWTEMMTNPRNMIKYWHKLTS